MATRTARSAGNGREPPSADGRRERSRSSRARIVQAMLDLVGGGHIAPSAAEVAEQAGVGLRSVFRHFDDMDSLYSEMSDAIEVRLMPVLLKPLAATEWKPRVRELAERRMTVFETMLPYRISVPSVRGYIVRSRNP